MNNTNKLKFGQFSIGLDMPNICFGKHNCNYQTLKDGKHHIQNLQYLTPQENRSKGNK